MLLAFDTSTPAVTVAVHDGTGVVASATEIDPLRHGELLAPTIVRVLRRAKAERGDLTAVAVGVGPGPFTGLRVGVTTARVMGSTLRIPVRGVCSLDVMAVEAVDDFGVSQPFRVATDARRKEIYWAVYDEAGRRLDGPFVDRPAEVPDGPPFVGAGAELYPELLPDVPGPTYPSAAHLATAVATERVTFLDPEPLYLRRPDAAQPSRPKKVS